MTVEYKYEPADFLFFSKDRAKWLPDSLSQMYYFVIIPLLAVALAVVAQSLAIGLAFTLVYVVAGWFINGQYRRRYGRIVHSEDYRTFNACMWKATLRDDGISFTSDPVDMLYRWRFVTEVFKGTRYIHIVLTQVQRVHIPVRAFTDDEHLKTFVAKAQSFVKSHAA